jgi:predicted nucleic acid-binding protein
MVASSEAFGLSELVLSAFIRVVTNPRAFAEPDSLAGAFGFTASLREQPNAVIVSPGPRHWDIFARLC